VKGIAKGCELSSSALIGGETAEMPGFYSDGEYDIAGFSVGSVSKKKIIDGSKIKKGDVIIGLPSSGVHSNGFSLVRKIVDSAKISKEEKLKLKKALLTPTKIYVKEVMPFLNDIHGLVHMTGGGYPENVPRIIPDGLCAKIDKGAWKPLKIFRDIQALGNVSEEEMYKTFNMGMGMIIICPEKKAESILTGIKGAKIIGEIVQNKERKLLI
jgi:phosphoribosylformylglycinamidine cyclo-ligase